MTKLFKDRLAVAFLLLSGCMFVVNCASGDQKVVWQKMEPVDFAGSVAVVIEKSPEVQIPEAEWQYLESDIKAKVGALFRGTAKDKPFVVKVSITRYTEGNAFARFMLAGLGQMHLDASVEVKQTKPEGQVRLGDMKKNYSWGGVVGGSATMHDSINIKVGQAIADAIAETLPAAGAS